LRYFAGELTALSQTLSLVVTGEGLAARTLPLSAFGVEVLPFGPKEGVPQHKILATQA